VSVYVYVMNETTNVVTMVILRLCCILWVRNCVRVIDCERGRPTLSLARVSVQLLVLAWRGVARLGGGPEVM